MDNSRLCYISRNYPNSNVAGFKAKQDSEDTVRLMGGVNLGLERTHVGNKVAAFLLNLTGIAKSMLLLRRGDVLFLQYPLKKYFKVVCRTARRKGAKTIVLAHDLRCYHHVELPETVDTDSLKLADYVIVGTDAMADWLRERGIENVGVMGLWDFRSAKEYLPDGSARSWGSSEPVVVYAGSIRRYRSQYLADLGNQDLPYNIHLYGHLRDMTELKKMKHIKAYPFMDSDEFIEKVRGDFGLVWDSVSTKGGDGDSGNYITLCLSHKTSFYLRAGLPVIVWRGSAVAPTIEKEGIGIAVDNLEELATVLPAISREQMASMRQNVCRVGHLLADGHYLRAAIEKAYSPSVMSPST